jgi:hypothetical protein
MYPKLKPYNTSMYRRHSRQRYAISFTLHLRTPLGNKHWTQKFLCVKARLFSTVSQKQWLCRHFVYLRVHCGYDTFSVLVCDRYCNCKLLWSAILPGNCFEYSHSA